MRKTPQEIISQIQSDRREGARFTNLMSKYSMPSSTLHRIIKEIKTPPHGKQHICRALTIKQEKEMCSRYNAGESSTTLSHHYGIGVWAVLNILREYGVEAKKPGMYNYPVTDATRVQISEAAKRLWRDRREEMLGHIRKISFKPGPDLEIRLTLRSQVRLRRLMLAKQDYCNRCGSKQKLHIHHIKAVQEYPELAMDIGNCEVLCQRCHGKEEANRKRKSDTINSDPLKIWPTLKGRRIV